MRVAISVLFLTVFCTGQCLASVKADVKKGNLLYNNKKYSEAAKAYETALSKKPDFGTANFNHACALYKEGEYYNSIESANKAIASGEKDKVISAADYNIGNATYRIGLSKESGDPKRAEEFYDTALKYYKRAIDLNPSDMDAKFNYEYVWNRLAALKEKKQQEKKEEKTKEKKEQNKEKDKNKENQSKGGGGGSEENKDKNKEDKSGGGGTSENKQQASQQKNAQSGENKKEEPKAGGASEAGNEGQGGQQGKQQEGKGGQSSKAGESHQEKEKEGSPGGGAQTTEEEKARDQENKPSNAEPQKETGKEEEAKGAGGEGKKEESKKDEKPSLSAYQAPQSQEEAGEMSEQEAKMLLDGYKGEEATGRTIRMRRKMVNEPEPAKDW